MLYIQFIKHTIPPHDKLYRQLLMCGKNLSIEIGDQFLNGSCRKSR
jgi:hypothetical protein